MPPSANLLKFHGRGHFPPRLLAGRLDGFCPPVPLPAMGDVGVRSRAGGAASRVPLGQTLALRPMARAAGVRGGGGAVLSNQRCHTPASPANKGLREFGSPMPQAAGPQAFTRHIFPQKLQSPARASLAAPPAISHAPNPTRQSAAAARRFPLQTASAPAGRDYPRQSHRAAHPW